MFGRKKRERVYELAEFVKTYEDVGLDENTGLPQLPEGFYWGISALEESVGANGCYRTVTLYTPEGKSVRHRREYFTEYNRYTVARERDEIRKMAGKILSLVTYGVEGKDGDTLAGLYPPKKLGL